MIERWREFWRTGSGGEPADAGPLFSRDSGLVFAGSFLLLALLTPRGLPNGDAAVYAQQVLAGDFSSRPVHLGYYLLAAAASFGQDVPDRFFNLLSSFFAAGSLALVFLLAKKALGGDRQLALVAPLALLGNALFLENAVQAEIYSTQTFFLVAAWYWWVAEKPLGAGLAFGVAGLVTPSSVFFAAAFPLLRWGRWRHLLILAAAAGGLVAAGVLPLAHEYFYGDRGLLVAAAKAMSPAQRVLKEGFEVLTGFFALLPLLALGARRALRQPPLRPLLLAWSAVWAVTFLLGERFKDVPAQLPTWTIAAIFVALGVRELAEAVAAAPPGPRQLLTWTGFCLAAATPQVMLLVVIGRLSAGSAAPRPVILAGLATLVAGWVLGWYRHGRGQTRAVGGIFLLTALLASANIGWRFVLFANQKIEQRRLACLELGRQAAPDYRAIGSWESGILLEHYLYRRSYTEHFLNVAWLEGGWGAERQQRASAELDAALAAGKEIWLLGALPKWEARLVAAGYHLAPGGGETLMRKATRELPAEAAGTPQP